MTSVLRRIRSRICLLRGGAGSRCILRRWRRLALLLVVAFEIWGVAVWGGEEEVEIIECRRQKICVRTVWMKDGCLEAHLWW